MARSRATGLFGVTDRVRYECVLRFVFSSAFAARVGRAKKPAQCSDSPDGTAFTPFPSLSRRSHTALTPLSHRSHTALTPLSHRSHTALAPLSPRPTHAYIDACALRTDRAAEGSVRFAFLRDHQTN